MEPGEDGNQGGLGILGLDPDSVDGYGNPDCCAICELKRALRPLRTKGSKQEQSALDALLESWTNQGEELEMMRGAR